MGKKWGTAMRATITYTMKRFGTWLAAGALLAALAGPALAGDAPSGFSFEVRPFSWGAKVAVRYDHPLLGWIEAGSVDFEKSGRVVLSVRGQTPREVDDLGGELSDLTRRGLGDPSLGLRLASHIRERVGVL